MEPEWRREPKKGEIEIVVRKALGRNEFTPVTVGQPERKACSREYVVRCSSGLASCFPSQSSSPLYVLRVFSSVVPRRKTRCEVATLDFVRRKFKLPVPTVQAFHSGNQNEIGFEWILADRLSGRPLADCWSTRPWPAKERLVQRLASITATMYRRQFRRIGGIMPDEACIRTLDGMERLEREPIEPALPQTIQDWLPWVTSRLRLGDNNNNSPKIDEVVSPDFYWGDRTLQPVPRGPFRTSHAWLSARLRLLETERSNPVLQFEGKVLFQAEKDRILREMSKQLQIVQQLKRLLPWFFPANEFAETTVLSLYHIGWEHILVDEQGKLTGLVDCWENVTTMPRWKACTYPAFLDQGRDHEDEESYSDYAALSNAEDEVAENEDEGQQARLESELTRLRAVFRDEMQQLAPGWDTEFRNGRGRRDFELAMRQVDAGENLDVVLGWLQDVEQRGADRAGQGLRERLIERGSSSRAGSDNNNDNDNEDDPYLQGDSDSCSA